MAREDVELLSRWASIGDATAFNQLVTEYSELVYGTCRRILRTHADAEEASQECFIRLAEKPPKVDLSLGAWLHRVATNICVSRIRSDSRRRAREEQFAEQLPRLAEPTWEDVQEMVDEAIEELPEELREAVVGSFLHRKTHAEIAEAHSIDRSTVTRRIDRGVERIRDALAKRGVSVMPAVLPGWLESNLTVSVPQALSAKLGKIAIAGGRIRATSTAQSKAGAFGKGMGALATGAIGIAVVGIGAFATWFATDAWRSDDDPLPERQMTATDPVSDEGIVGGVQESDEAIVSGVDSTEPQLAPSMTAEEPAEASAVAAALPVDTLVSGTVTARMDGEPLAEVVVFALAAGTNSEHAVEVQTGIDGTFSIANLPYGEYRIGCQLPEGFLGVADGNSHSTVNLSQSLASVTDVDFELSQGGVLEGTVVSDGKPWANQTIRIWSYGSNDDVGNTGLIQGDIELDGRGRFRVTGLEPFDGMLMAQRRRADGSLQEALPVAVLVEMDKVRVETFDFVSGTSSIEGNVTFGADKIPLRANVQVHFTWLEDGEYTEESYRLATDDNGYYYFDELTAGYAKIHVWPSGSTEMGSQIEALRLEEGEHKVQDFHFSQHVLQYDLTNIPDWAVEIMVAIFPGDYTPQIDSMAGFLEARENMLSGERIKLATPPAMTKELRGLQPGSYNVCVMVWPVHYNMGAIQNFGGVEKVLEEMVVINDVLTIPEGSATDYIAFDIAAQP